MSKQIRTSNPKQKTKRSWKRAISVSMISDISNFGFCFGFRDSNFESYLVIAFFQRNIRDESCHLRLPDDHWCLIPAQRARCTSRQFFFKQKTAYEVAEVEPDPEKQRAWLTFAVIGAGPTGVEMAGQIAELSRRALKRNFRRIEPASARVLLFDGGHEPLATFGDRLCAIATKEIERTGVELRMRSRVTDVVYDAIVVQGPSGEERVACHTKVWSAGVQASPLGAILAAACGAQTDRAGRVEVLPDCTLPGHPEVFVIGDMMSLNDLPGVAEVAMQSGIHAA